MLYDIYYWGQLDSYTVTHSKATRYEGRWRGTVYSDSADWTEYGLTAEEVKNLGLDLPESL